MRSLNFNTLSIEFEVPHFKVYNVYKINDIKELFMKMFNRKALIFTIILSIIVLTSGCSLIPKQSKPESEESVQQKVISYMTTQGYKESTYNVTVEATQSPLKGFAGPYIIRISFKDNPDEVYSYSYNKAQNEDISEIGIDPPKAKKGNSEGK